MPKSLYYILFFVLLGCQNPVPRFPVVKRSGTNLNAFVDQNKILVELQNTAFLKIIKENPDKTFANSQSGFWYTFIKKNEVSTNKPALGDIVEFTYQVTDLNNNIIYSTQEIGLQHYIIDKEDIISGLQQGLKLMKEGEVVLFLMPSFRAYGVLGDRNKIKTNQPLIYTVYLDKIIIKKNNK